MNDDYSNDVETAAQLAYDYDDDRRLDAQREEYDDAHPPDTECPECGYEWHGGWSRGTRIDPPEPRYPDCPRCEGEAT